jgi:hypothetical protein
MKVFATADGGAIVMLTQKEFKALGTLERYASEGIQVVNNLTEKVAQIYKQEQEEKNA